MRNVNFDEARTLCQELPRIKERLMRAGLLKTGHAMEEAVTSVGYELAELLEQATLEATSPEVHE